MEEHEWSDGQAAEGERRLNAYREHEIEVAKSPQGTVVYIIDGYPRMERPEWLTDDGVTLTRWDREAIARQAVVQKSGWMFWADGMKVRSVNKVLEAMLVFSAFGLILGVMAIAKELRHPGFIFVIGIMVALGGSIMSQSVTATLLMFSVIVLSGFSTRFLICRLFAFDR